MGLIKSICGLVDLWRPRHKCCICLTMIRDVDLAITPCFHYFDKECIKKWMAENKSCPLCRHQIRCYRLLGINNTSHG